MNPDYYKILGVVDTAEDAVIRAAYKALMQIYHPDKFNGDRAEAERRTKDIVEAYSVLSDPAKRKAYDQRRAEEKPEYHSDPDGSDHRGFRAAEETLNAKWEMAAEYVHGLKVLYNNLASISPELAYTFKLCLLEQKAFDRATLIANGLEDQYLTKYFGSNASIKIFAKKLLSGGYKEAARELNSVITVLGSSVNAADVIYRIAKKYKVPSYQQAGDPTGGGKDAWREEKDEKQLPEGCAVILWLALGVVIFTVITFLIIGVGQKLLGM
jgi:curved DNA-binding protein CbpA